MFKYFKKAFLNHWNLLALAGGIGAALISGIGTGGLGATIGLPLVAAAELVYLTFLATNDRFQRHVEAQEHKLKRADRGEDVVRQVKRIIRTLPRESRERYENLRQRCVELQQIAKDLKHGRGDTSSPLQSFQNEGLDKLLWIFLRLLFTQQSLVRFLQKTRVESINGDIERLENRLKLLEDDQSDHASKIRRTIVDNLETCRNRLANYDQARANHEYVELELDRLENKIKSLAEVAINRQEPDYVSSQVDAVAGSMLETEQTMNELDFVTGLGPLEDEVPTLLNPPVEVIE